MMIRKPTYAGQVQTKDEMDIKYWATEKTTWERLFESWSPNCMNHGILLDPRLDKAVSKARKGC